MKMKGKAASGKALWLLCIACFLAGSIFRTWTLHIYQKQNQQTPINYQQHDTKLADEELSSDNNKPLMSIGGKSVNVMSEVKRTHQAIQSLEKTISALEMEMAVARTSHIDGQNSQGRASNHSLQKAFVVIGINTAFSSKKRRDSVRASWMPTGSIAPALSTSMNSF